MDPCLGLDGVQAIALHEAFQLLRFVAIHEPDLAADPFEEGFEEQWNHQHHRRLRNELGEGLVKTLTHQRMDCLLYTSDAADE